MTEEQKKIIRQGAARLRGRGTQFGIAAFAASALILTSVPSASGASSPVLKSAKVPEFPGALASRTSRTLYVLSSEKGAKIKCKAACLATWPPLLVKTSVTAISLGAGVKGKVGFVARSKTMKQVTFNSFPVYTYQGDTGVLQTNGEGINAFGGTWTLAKAKSSSPATTAYPASTMTTTTGAY